MIWVALMREKERDMYFKSSSHNYSTILGPQSR